MKKFLLAGAAFGALIGPALGSDMLPPRDRVPAYVWNGWYAGLNAGIAFTGLDAGTASVNTFAAPGAGPLATAISSYANAPVHLTGKVTQVAWNNPHVMIQMTESGNRVWTLEAASPDELARKGWSRDTLKTGDQITVEGFRAKSEPMTAAARVIGLPSGKRMSAADDQDGGPKSPTP